MTLINEATKYSFYLSLNVPSLVERLKSETNLRPLIKGLTEDQLFEFIGKHLFERTQYYNQAQFVIKADNKSEKDVIEDILMALI